MIRVSFRDSVPALLSARARKAFQLANQEAQRLNHRAVGTEHLLLGLAKEGASPGAWALRWSGFDLAWLRRQVERRHPPESGAEVLPGALPYAAELVEYLDRITAGAYQQSASTTPQQLLAGLVREPNGRVADILTRRRISWWLVRWLLRRVYRTRFLSGCCR